MNQTYDVAKEIALKLSDRKAHDVCLIDISEKSSFADYFVNATAGSERQLGALLDEAEEKAIKLGVEPRSIEGRAGTGWILMDCGDVIINLFTDETRNRYSLDKIWGDCEIEKIEE